MTKVFVYGTLKSGGAIRGLDGQPGAELLGDAVTTDSSYTLFDLGSFPAVGLKGNNKIKGEVWEIDEEIFASLDRIEGYPDFYNRKQVETNKGTVWMYYIPGIEEEHHIYRDIAKIDNEAGKALEWNA
jgi:gamma-glutamylcyclotransferase (GGCT)/AIG2-like uncharacterized protein YtfP